MNHDFEKARGKYRAQANRFSSFNGSEVKAQNFVGQSSRFAGQASNADGMNSFAALQDSNKILTVVCSNTATAGADVECIVFGAFQYSGSTQPNAGAVVTINESTHAEVREQSKSQPFWINGFRYKGSVASQLDKIAKIVYKNPSGDETTKKFSASTYLTAAQLNTLQADITNYSFGVDGTTQIVVPVSFGQYVTLILQIGGRFDASNLVEGTSPILVANQKALNSGLVTIQEAR